MENIDPKSKLPQAVRLAEQIDNVYKLQTMGFLDTITELLDNSDDVSTAIHYLRSLLSTSLQALDQAAYGQETEGMDSNLN